MKLGDFKTFIRSMVPSANKSAVNDTFLEMLINKGVREVNILTAAFVGDAYFDISEDIKTYNLRDEVEDNDFVGIGPSGLWMNKGSASSPNWRQLDGVTRAFIDEKYPNWINASSGNPLMYFVKSGQLVVYPANDADLTDGFWLPDYVKKAVDMTNDEHYPFTGSDNKLADLEPLDDAIIDYVRWHLKHSVGSDQKGIITRQEFEACVQKRKRVINNRPDIAKTNHNFRMRGRKIC